MDGEEDIGYVCEALRHTLIALSQLRTADHLSTLLLKAARTGAKVYYIVDN